MRVRPTIMLVVSAVLFLGSLVTAILVDMRMPSSFEPPQKLSDVKTPVDLSYIGGAWVLVHGCSRILILTSQDGKTWSEMISPPAENREKRSCARIKLIDYNGNIGIIWGDRLGTSKEYFFYLSIFDGKFWSAPQLVLMRSAPLKLKDAVLLEGGALLLAWEEPAVTQGKDGNPVSDWDHATAYRALISDDIHIERVITPDAPSFNMDACSFVRDEGKIWCVFHYTDLKDSYFRSGSTDGMTWSVPEPFDVPADIEEFIDLRNGIGAWDIRYEELTLMTSKDWKKWEKEIMWKKRVILGILDAEFAMGPTGLCAVGEDYDGVFVSQQSADLLREQQKTRSLFAKLVYVSCCASLATLGFFVVWLWRQ